MPYISPEARERLASQTQFPSINNAGSLNFLICKLILHYLEGKENVNYQDFNDILGALEGAKQEIYRRLIQPYEEKKISENGDIF